MRRTAAFLFFVLWFLSIGTFADQKYVPGRIIIKTVPNAIKTQTGLLSTSSNIAAQNIASSLQSKNIKLK